MSNQCRKFSKCDFNRGMNNLPLVRGFEVRKWIEGFPVFNLILYKHVKQVLPSELYNTKSLYNKSALGVNLVTTQNLKSMPPSTLKKVK